MNLCILFGGKSYEHAISIVSAITLKKLLPEVRHFIFLDSNHNFYHIPAEQMQSKFFSNKSYEKAQKIYLKKDGFYTRTFFGQKPLHFPTILNLIHGGDGEDGTLASLLDFYGIPYIGPRNPACVLSYDKELMKSFAKSRGVKCLTYRVLYYNDTPPNDLNFPVIIKPARLGSSLGINIVESQADLQYALDCAFEYDEKIIIEPFIAGIKEYNLAGFKGKEGIQFSFIEEPEKNKMLDFEKKYLDFSRTSNAKEAEISDTLKQALQESFTKLYTNAFEGALIRCDFFVKEGECYLNEINPVPGSLANYLFKDFRNALESLLHALPKPNSIKADYALLHTIQFAKGK
ncbi:D-alanine--D-alanine ligase [Helicobacter sp.]|uniref:D-alanine--D-alanine ligase n=1 Tax=Helicobacter sp. TaxID=218 RepID=UPI0025BBAF9F|nr:D-alanine--D-alanine ligase [Helicobacter sp.]MCI5969381.1 D-alanine--D-alanine ligase [Helicobacter sp.]MDY2585636.1 D-alanine--D-alanine ligase [Helicobacter sp.]